MTLLLIAIAVSITCLGYSIYAYRFCSREFAKLKKENPEGWKRYKERKSE